MTFLLLGGATAACGTASCVDDCVTSVGPNANAEKDAQALLTCASQNHCVPK